jgi:NAD(P)-dependent dehydrogenase (short-subunit alcohol dehydrogenase family)
MHMKKLSGKVAIITGAGQGIGFGVAQAFAREGAHVVLTGRDSAKLERAAKSVREQGVEALVIPGDVRKRETAEKTLAETIAKFGKLDILVNNAQIFQVLIPLAEISQEQTEAVLESGFWGTFYFMRAALPPMKQAGGGSIINLGSREGINGTVGFSIYAATKEAIRGLSRAAAREWGEFNIRVNVICPAARSEAADKFFVDFPDQKQHYLGQIAMRRLGEPDTDIANVVVFLASAQSGFVTGQTINVDGGLTML